MRSRRILTGLAAAALCLAALGVRAEEIQVLKIGERFGAAEAYRIEETYYLALKDAARIYDAKADYYNASGKVALSLRGRKAVFGIGGAEVLVGEKRVEMAHKMLIRQDRAWIPMELFEGEEFSALAGLNSRFDPKARLLSVERRVNIGRLRWHTYPDHTRIALEIGEGLPYRAEKRGLRALDIGIPGGFLSAPEKAEVADGAVQAVHLDQELRQARLSVGLASDSARWTLKEFDKPRRIVLDVERPTAPANSEEETVLASVSASAERPAPAAAPAAEPIGAEPPAQPEAPVRVNPSAKATGEGNTQGVAPPAPARTPRKVRVAIDPGHGGRDSGAVGRRGIREKDINLLLGKELGRLLEDGGIDVLLTRQTDDFLPLSDRAKLANDWGADLFISLHCNAHRSRLEKGYEIYFLSEQASDPEAERLAEFENSVLRLEEKGEVEDEAAGVLFQLARTEFINDSSELSGLLARSLARRVDMPNRGVKQASFYVLRGANEPAVLVEAGYATNAKEAAKLETKKYRRQIAEGLLAGILEFAELKGWQPPRRGRGGAR